MPIPKSVLSLREFIVSADWGEAGRALLTAPVRRSGRAVESSASAMVSAAIASSIRLDWAFALERSFTRRLIYRGTELPSWFVVGLWRCLNIGATMRRWSIEPCGTMGSLFRGQGSPMASLETLIWINMQLIPLKIWRALSTIAANRTLSLKLAGWTENCTLLGGRYVTSWPKRRSLSITTFRCCRNSMPSPRRRCSSSMKISPQRS